MTKVKRQRSCIACKMQDDKVNLYRIVRDSEGHVSFDASGRAAGRGAYVCSGACFEKARKSRRLQSSLRVSVSEEDYEAVARALRSAIAHEEEEN